MVRISYPGDGKAAESPVERATKSISETAIEGVSTLVRPILDAGDASF
jgi:hypothetical protein